MGEASFADMFGAVKLVARTHLRSPTSLRITPIRYRLVRNIRARDIGNWLDFDGSVEWEIGGLDGSGSLNPRVPAPCKVGMVALNHNALLDEMDRFSDSRLGFVRAVGGAVVYGSLPRHVLPRDYDLAYHDYVFGVCLGAGVLSVLPVLRANDGWMRVPDADIAPLGVTEIGAVPLSVRVY